MGARIANRDWAVAATFLAIASLGGIALSLTTAPSYLANITIAVEASDFEAASSDVRLAQLARLHTADIAKSFQSDPTIILPAASGPDATAFAEANSPSNAAAAAQMGARRFQSAIQASAGDEGTRFEARLQQTTLTTRLSSPHPWLVSSLGLVLGLLAGAVWLRRSRIRSAPRFLPRRNTTTRDGLRP